MKEKSKALVYKSFLQFKKLIGIQRRKIEQVEVMLSKGSKLGVKLCKFVGAVHWVRGVAHTSGTAHWATLHSVKIILARHIQESRCIELPSPISS